MNNFYKILENELQNLLPKLIEFRKELHSYPETAWQEKETRKRLLSFLEGCEKTVHNPYLNTDLVFDMTNEEINDKESLLLRSDMDALKQWETTEIPYKSKNEGAAHSCGHDGHMTMLCGAALLIDSMIKKGFSLPRPVRFVFQPAEELECGGSDLVKKGILEGTTNTLAIHGWPFLEKGKLFSKSGPFFAAAATFVTTIEGMATHGAMPQKGRSPFPSAANMIQEIEKIGKIYSERAIISSCMINGGSSDNIIPGSIEIRGTIRYYNREHYKEIQKLFEKAGNTIFQKTNCKIKTEYISKYNIPLYNDGDFLKALSGALEQGSGNFGEIPRTIETTEAKTVSEDFSFYTDRRPGAMVLLGLGDETPPLHAQDFNFPDEVLHKGILLFTEAAFHLK